MVKFWQKKYVSKYTGKEIDDAVAKAETALQNPMTAAGDLIVGGEDGAANKLTKGSDGKVLKMVSGAPAWADDSSGMTNPMTTAGDIIVGGADGAASRLGKGTDGQVLSMVSGAPAWAAGSGGAEHLYWHSVSIESLASTNIPNLYIAIISTSSEAFTATSLFDFIHNKTGLFIVASGTFFINSNDGYVIPATIQGTTTNGIVKITGFRISNLSLTYFTYTKDNNTKVTDTIDQIF